MRNAFLPGNKAREGEPQEKTQFIKYFLEEISKENGLGGPELKIKKSPYMTAAVSLRPTKYKITFTTSLLENLSLQELQAITAHEVLHRKKHPISLFRLSLAPITFINQYSAIFSICEWAISDSMWKGGVVFAATSAILYLHRFTMHKKEHEADAFAAKAVSKEDIASALLKIYENNKQKTAERILALPKAFCWLANIASEALLQLQQKMPTSKALGLLQKASEDLSKIFGRIYRAEMEAVKAVLDFLAKLYSISPYSTHPSIVKRLKEISKIKES
ncbi:MAG: M48 family metalloprotease [Candidatus Anstonellaceae archaeon]